jgi:hypothetical protein
MSTRIVCDWDGHRDSETVYQTEECNNSHHVYGDSTGWRLTDSEDGVGDYCPDHAPHICGVCGEPNLNTEACPDEQEVCLTCCGEEH